jgi:hypothetical protein
MAVGLRHLWRPRGVYADAAADHRSEIVERHWRPWLTDPAAIASLADRSGIEPRLVLAIAPPGYHLARAKRCALNHRAFLHLVYSDGAREFSAYLRPTDAQAPAELGQSVASPYMKDFGAEHTGCVETPRVTAVIVTDESADSTRELARFAGAALGVHSTAF